MLLVKWQSARGGFDSAEANDKANKDPVHWLKTDASQAPAVYSGHRAPLRPHLVLGAGARVSALGPDP